VKELITIGSELTIVASSISTQTELLLYVFFIGCINMFLMTGTNEECFVYLA